MEWQNNEFDLEEAKGWKKYGFTQKEAKEWKDNGFTPQDAKDLKIRRILSPPYKKTKNF